MSTTPGTRRMPPDRAVIVVATSDQDDRRVVGQVLDDGLDQPLAVRAADPMGVVEHQHEGSGPLGQPDLESPDVRVGDARSTDGGGMVTIPASAVCSVWNSVTGSSSVRRRSIQQTGRASVVIQRATRLVLPYPDGARTRRSRPAASRYRWSIRSTFDEVGGRRRYRRRRLRSLVIARRCRHLRSLQHAETRGWAAGPRRE